MRWDEMLVDLFEDLEQQAEGLHLEERDAEVADRTRAEYAAQVDFVSRIHASVGASLVLSVAGVGTLTGALRSAGADWCLLTTGAQQEWLVRLAALGEVRGVSARSVSEAARPVTARLGIGSALRRIAEAAATTVLHRTDGATTAGLIGRVGSDFVELRDTAAAAPDRSTVVLAVVPFGQLAAVRRT
jgi:hypothetical protein